MTNVTSRENFIWVNKTSLLTTCGCVLRVACYILYICEWFMAVRTICTGLSRLASNLKSHVKLFTYLVESTAFAFRETERMACKQNQIPFLASIKYYLCTSNAGWGIEHVMNKLHVGRFNYVH